MRRYITQILKFSYLCTVFRKETGRIGTPPAERPKNKVHVRSGIARVAGRSFIIKLKEKSMVTADIRKKMNKEFRVKVNKGHISILVGWEGLVDYVGRNKAFCLVSEALKRDVDKWSWIGRNGLKIAFYVK